MDQKRKFRLKILIIGDLATGKTSFVQRYIHDLFPMGIDYAVKFVKYDDDSVIRLDLMDLQNRGGTASMSRAYYRNAVGCFIVFDVTRGSTFESVTKWKTDLDDKAQLPDGSPLPCVLLANKCDLSKEGLVNNAQQMDEFCKEKGFAKWFETSAEENINIEASTRFLISEIMKRTELQSHLLQPSESRPGDIQVHGQTAQKSAGRNFCGGWW